MILYHTGFDVIEKPDIHHGRKNADYLAVQAAATVRAVSEDSNGPASICVHTRRAFPAAIGMSGSGGQAPR